MATDIKLGTIPTGPQKRDAIHIAIAPMVAGEGLMPGDHVGILPDGTAGRKADPPIGIVDPFLREAVNAGERFYLLLYQFTVTGMRHQWSHPAFADDTGGEVGVVRNIKESEAWIRSFASDWNINFNELIRVASGPLEEDGDNWVVADGIDLHSASELGESHDLFWHHLEILTGRHFSPEHRGRMSWSCSC